MAEPQILEAMDPAQDLMAVRELLEEGKVDQARALVLELESRWPESEKVQYFREVLGSLRITVRVGERGRPLDRERAWLDAHAAEYPGCWIAVKQDRLVAADPSLKVVQRAVKTDPENLDAVIHYQEPPNSPC